MKNKKLFLPVIITLIMAASGVKAQMPASEKELSTETNIRFSLFNQEVKPGKVELMAEVKNAGAEYWELSNGVKVYIKPLNSKDEIKLYAFRNGGLNIHVPGDLPSAESAVPLAVASGLSYFDKSLLTRILDGKEVQLSPYMNEYYEGFNGKVSQKDFETLLQMVNLSMTHPKLDETAFAAYKSKLIADNELGQKDPNIFFEDHLNQMLYNHHALKPMHDKEYISGMDYSKTKRIYQYHFSNANDFTFVLVGNIDKEKDRVLIEKYLASLPVSDKNYFFQPAYTEYSKGSLQNVVSYPMDSKKARVHIGFQGEANRDYSMRLNFSVLEALLTSKLSEKMKAEQTQCDLLVSNEVKAYPNPHYQFTMRFQCAPENTAKITSWIQSEIESIKAQGPTATDLQNAKNLMISNHLTKVKDNDFWVNTLANAVHFKEDVMSEEDYALLLNKIEVKDMQQFAKQYLGENKIELVLNQASKSI